jgi:adenylate cyclase
MISPMRMLFPRMAHAVNGASPEAPLHDVGFERELGHQTLINERRRAIILLWTLTAVLVIRTLYLILHGFDESALPGRRFVLLMLAFWIGLEAFTVGFVRRCIRKGKEPAPLQAYVSSALEVAMPTITMWILCQFGSPVSSLTGSLNCAYFLIIILSPLWLNPWLCIFTGALAAAGYGVLVGSYWQELARGWAGSIALMHLSFFSRGMLLLAGGLAAGFVSLRIRTTIIETLREVRERERVIDLFGQHVSPTVVNQLLSQPTGQTPELREVCVMVLDIRNFTTFSELRPADEVVRYLNTLWGFMVRTVNEHNGIVNKFLGDGFLAVFGAPLTTGQDCANAIAASRRVIGELEQFAAAGTLPATQIGIALHAGSVIAGNIGSAERKEYTVIGDVVNVAFRIERLNKEFGSKLLISERVRQKAGPDGAGERVPAIAIPGRSAPVGLFRLA